MKPILLAITVPLLLACAPASAENAEGYWSGSIANALKVSVHFAKSNDNVWEATITVPSQNLVARVDQVVVTPERVSFKMTKLNASYAASWDAAQQAWIGSWMQGRAAPLNLTRSSAAALKPKRPQEAAIASRAPTYSSIDVRFGNLAGTLTVPRGASPFPAVVLVHGSGAIDRDGTVFNHQPYLVLADHLSRNGIAVLRYDKRGVGKSGGDLKAATTLDLATDADSAVTFLRNRPEIDQRHIGVIGHSEGGLIAPLIAARDDRLAFAVLLAAPGIRGDRLLVEQLALTSKARGATDAVVARERAQYQTLFAAMVAEPTAEGARARAGVLLDQAEQRGDIPAGAAKALLERFGTPWFHALLRYDPVPALQALRQPVLVLNGERDLQVPAELDLGAIRLALRGNDHAIVKQLPGLNHLFQTAPTGSPAEYGEIEESVAPAALEAISAWIVATVR